MLSWTLKKKKRLRIIPLLLPQFLRLIDVQDIRMWHLEDRFRLLLWQEILYLRLKINEFGKKSLIPSSPSFETKSRRELS